MLQYIYLRAELLVAYFQSVKISDISDPTKTDLFLPTKLIVLLVNIIL